MTEREFATEVVAKLQGAGFQALWAGGCVRDELLGITPADYDVASDARPEQVQKLFRRTHSFGASFGVVEVLGPRDPNGEWTKVQVATFRSDGTYSDGRRPDSVTFSSPEEDAKRRDFTINGMFFDPLAKQVIDYVGGQADLKAKVLRAIGVAEERFTEDKLRILRAVRMAARFELAIDAGTFAAARRMADQIRVVSAERIAEELRKILTNQHRARGVRLLREFGLVEYILPEAAENDSALEQLPNDASFELAFAVVLHGLDKAHITELARRLRLSNAETDRIAWLVQHDRFLVNATTLRGSQLKPVLVHPGIGELLTLHRTNGIDVEFCERMLRETPPEALNPLPLITGNDLRDSGLKPGPDFKRLLDAIREAQLDGTITTKEEAQALARELRASAS